jgi:thioredoxin reductase (NADPH)
MLNIDRLENYPGACESAGTGEAAAGIMRRQAAGAGAEFLAGTVQGLAGNEGGGFTLTVDEYAESSGGVIQAGAVIIATGARRKKLGVPGEDEFFGRGVSYCAACDGPFFKGKKIFVVGGGDAACDEAGFLSRISASVHLVHRRGVLRAQNAVAARVLANPAIEVTLNTRVTAIKGDKKVEAVALENVESGALREESADAVFIFAGISPRSELASAAALKVRPALDDALFIITDQRMETAAAGIFAAGDVRASAFRQVVTAASDGAIAAHCAAKYIEETRKR